MALEKSPYIGKQAQHSDDDWRYYQLKERSKSCSMSIPSIIVSPSKFPNSSPTHGNANNDIDSMFEPGYRNIPTSPRNYKASPHQSQPSSPYHDSAYGSSPPSPCNFFPSPHRSQPTSPYHDCPSSPIPNALYSSQQDNSPFFQFGTYLTPHSFKSNNISHSGGRCFIPEKETQSNSSSNLFVLRNAGETMQNQDKSVIYAHSHSYQSCQQSTVNAGNIRAKSISNESSVICNAANRQCLGTNTTMAIPQCSELSNTVPSTTVHCIPNNQTINSSVLQQKIQDEFIAQRAVAPELIAKYSHNSGYGRIDDSPDEWTDKAYYFSGNMNSSKSNNAPYLSNLSIPQQAETWEFKSISHPYVSRNTGYTMQNQSSSSIHVNNSYLQINPQNCQSYTSCQQPIANGEYARAISVSSNESKLIINTENVQYNGTARSTTEIPHHISTNVLPTPDCSALANAIATTAAHCTQNIALTNNSFCQQQNQDEFMAQRATSLEVISSESHNSGYGRIDESPDDWQDISYIFNTSVPQQIKAQQLSTTSHSSVGRADLNSCSVQQQNPQEYIQMGVNYAQPTFNQREFQMEISQPSGYGSVTECPDFWMDDFDL
ncbi:unnamed protein product [Meganyctiphanes norvegica]|uniref:Uncharacterized protein n=1 Tax=Meganyctiphanes norvegica TaxID=48144 RepID=A0AAV2PMN5_MEGNR